MLRVASKRFRRLCLNAREPSSSDLPHATGEHVSAVSDIALTSIRNGQKLPYPNSANHNIDTTIVTFAGAARPPALDSIVLGLAEGCVDAAPDTLDAGTEAGNITPASLRVLSLDSLSSSMSPVMRSVNFVSVIVFDLSGSLVTVKSTSRLPRRTSVTLIRLRLAVPPNPSFLPMSLLKASLKALRTSSSS